MHVPFPGALMHPCVPHLELLSCQTIKKHTSHLLNQLMSTNRCLCIKGIQSF